jgi:putative component of membrane protein insertase Oxa1/YidC/SpoIIIJ protein YidD
MYQSLRFALLLDRLKDLHYTSNVGQIVRVISDETREFIKRCDETIDNVARNEEQSIYDEATEYIEDLLGISFVACQSYISYVVSDICRLHDACNSLASPVILTTTSGRKIDILRKCSPPVKGGYSEVQIIDAFANYYKHKDEWDWDWDCPPARSQLTVDVIRSVGASRGCTGNMRTGAEALGNGEYCDTRAMMKGLESWGQELFKAYSEELRVKGLLRDE